MSDPIIYDNEKRYIFSNWTDEDFTGVWAKAPTLIKKGETIELLEHKAVQFCRHLVNREMMKANIVAMDSAELRQPYINKTITEITAGVDSPALASLKEDIAKEIQGETPKEESGDMKSASVTGTGEFEDIDEPKEEVVKEEKPEPKVEEKPKAKAKKKK